MTKQTISEKHVKVSLSKISILETILKCESKWYWQRNYMKNRTSGLSPLILSISQFLPCGGFCNNVKLFKYWQVSFDKNKDSSRKFNWCENDVKNKGLYKKTTILLT